MNRMSGRARGACAVRMNQRSQQNVRAHAWRGPMEHWTQFEIDGFQRAEGVLHAAETF